eukprot:7148465-Prymnesium_polylepis.1
MRILVAWDEETAETWLKGGSVTDSHDIRCPVKVAEVLLQCTGEEPRPPVPLLPTTAQSACGPPS